jgi:hypothetical protein
MIKGTSFGARIASVNFLTFPPKLAADNWQLATAFRAMLRKTPTLQGDTSF